MGLLISINFQILIHLRACLLYECYWPLCITKFDHPCSHSPRIGQFLRNLFATENKILESYMDMAIRVMLFANCKIYFDFPTDFICLKKYLYIFFMKMLNL